MVPAFGAIPPNSGALAEPFLSVVNLPWCSTIVIHRFRETGIDPFAIHMYNTGAAMALVATFFGAGQSKLFTKHIQQTDSWIHKHLDRLPIYFHLQGRLFKKGSDGFMVFTRLYHRSRSETDCGERS